MDKIVQEMLDRLPPRKMRMPLAGNSATWPYHVMVCNPSIQEIWSRLSTIDLVSAFTNIYNLNKFTALSILNIADIAFSLNFFGLNTMRYQGFTEYRNNLLSSYSNSLRYTLNPDEYVLWDQPVRSMTNGEIVEIVDDYPDRLSKESFNGGFFGMKENDMYGNSITVRCNDIDYMYSCLKYRSTFKYKIGDKVMPGQVLGRVGCSGKLAKRPYLQVKARIRYKFNVHPLPKIVFPVPMLKFEPFYEMKLLNGSRFSPESLERTLVRDIKYIYNPGCILASGSLVRDVQEV